MKLVLRFLETRWKACCCAIVLMKLQTSNGEINPIFSDITNNFGKPQCKLEAVYTGKTIECVCACVD